LLNQVGSVAVEGAGVFISIILIIALIRRKWPMYWALLFAISTLIVTNGISASANLSIFLESITSHTAFYLVSMVLSITLLGHLHREIGAMEEMIGKLRLLIRDSRALVIFLPATISLFSSVPGGAIVSAPMVEETGRELKMPPLEQAVSNMVYRHLVVLVTPFNASLVMASALSGISIAGFLSYTVPVITIVFIITAIVIYRRYPDSGKTNNTEVQNKGTREILLNIIYLASPYLIAIILGLAVGVFFPLAILAGITVCLFIKMPRDKIWHTLQNRVITLSQGINWSLTISTLAIVIYKDFMLQAESFQQSVHYLLEIGIPLLLLIIILPFITGFITGNNAAALGISMPILIPLLGPEMMSMRYLGILYLSSYAGYFGSPVHLCTYVTNEYFKTPLYALIKHVNAYGALMLAVGLLLALLY